MTITSLGSHMFQTSAISELSSFFDRSLSLSDRKSSFFSNFATPSKLGFGVQLNPDVEEVSYFRISTVLFQ